MDKKIKNYLGFAGASALTVLTLLLVVGIYATYIFSKNISPVEHRNFSVSANGKVNTIPDVARINFSVITEGAKNINKLQKENSKKINNIIALIKKGGVEDKDVKTTNYSVVPRYSTFNCNPKNIEPCPPSEIIGYTVRVNVSVIIRNFDIIGTMLADITNKGANTISSPSFSVENLDSARATARAKAIEKAHKKAEEMAKAGGFRIGKLLSIQEGGSRYYPTMMRSESIAMPHKDTETPIPTIEPGSQDVNVSVTLKYEIK